MLIGEEKEVRIQTINSKQVLKTYIVRGHRVSVLVTRRDSTHEKDLAQNGSEKTEILKLAQILGNNDAS